MQSEFMHGALARLVSWWKHSGFDSREQPNGVH